MPSRNVQVHLPADPGTSVAVAVDVAGPMTPVQAVADFIQAQQALGASLGEAIGLAAAVHGEAAVMPLLDAELDRLESSPEKVDLMDAVALGSPDLANATLNDLLAAGRLSEWEDVDAAMGLHLGMRPWITSLPDVLQVTGSLYLEGCTDLIGMPTNLQVGRDLHLFGCVSLVRMPTHLQVAGSLNLFGCSALSELPTGLQVGSYLHLQGCAALQSLPSGLRVGGSLVLTGCTSWDGQIPEAAQVGGKVHTDRYRDGIRFQEWKGLSSAGSWGAQGRGIFRSAGMLAAAQAFLKRIRGKDQQ